MNFRNDRFLAGIIAAAVAMTFTANILSSIADDQNWWGWVFLPGQVFVAVMAVRSVWRDRA